MLKTIIYPAKPLEENRKAIEEAAAALREGETVIFPTETVYGLGANALDPLAAKKIYAAKGRPSDNPLIVHICSMKMLEDLALEIPPKALKIAEDFWPGPLTMILWKKSIVPHETTGGLETVAVRMPSDPLTLALIEEAGVPIAAPSANISGRPSITTGYHAALEMEGRVNRILMGEDSLIGLESTVIDMTVEPPVILRPGKIGPSELQAIISCKDQQNPRDIEEDQSKSPGMKYKHYSPKAAVWIASQREKDQSEQIRSWATKAVEEGKTVWIFCRESHGGWYEGQVYSLGDTGLEIAHRLFRALREADEKEVDLILSEDFFDEKDEVTAAVMNRLRKAESKK